MSNNLAYYFSKHGYNLQNTLDEDVNELVNVINDAYSYQDKTKGAPRTNTEHLRKRISATDFYTVLYDKEIIGCVYLEQRSPTLLFGLLTLTPEFRGKGIAKSIINAIDAYARNNNFEAIELDYMSLAPWLKKYYKKYGFIETGDVTQWGSIDLMKMRKKVQP